MLFLCYKVDIEEGILKKQINQFTQFKFCWSRSVVFSQMYLGIPCRFSASKIT